MATAPDGNSSSRKGREGRPILTLMRIGAALQDGSKLPGAEHGNHSEKPSEKQDFETWLWDARNQWDIGRRRGGLFGARLDKAGAEQALQHELAKLEGGAE